MSTLSIRWEPKESTRTPWIPGHGLCIYQGEPTAHNVRLVAHIDGFEWRRGAPEAVVVFDPRRLPRNATRTAEFRAAVEAKIRSGDLTTGEMLPGYWTIANA